MKKRIKASFSDKPAPATKTADPIELNDPENDPFGDTKRSVIRYRESLDELKESLRLAHGQWKAFQSLHFSEPEAIRDDIDPSRLRQAINDVFQSAQGTVKSPSRWGKCKRVIQVIYTALSPVLKNALVIGRDSSGVGSLY